LVTGGTGAGRGPVIGSPYRIQEVAEMLNGDIARYRIEDRIREGSSARTGRRVSKRHAAERRSRVTRLAGMTAALLPLPFKH
jgi:hypothetical protein